MRNRAKCKLCGDIIESYHPTDYVACKCDEISVSGGVAMQCAAKNFDNFLRVDDEDNEIIVKVVQDIPDESAHSENIPKKTDLIDMLKATIDSYDNLPPQALSAPVTHADMQSALMIIYAILRDK